MIRRLGAAHVSEYAPGECLPSPGAAARIGPEDRVAALEEHEKRRAPAAEPHRPPVPDRSTMYVENERSGSLMPRQQKPSLDVEPVGRLPAHSVDTIDYTRCLRIAEIE